MSCNKKHTLPEGKLPLPKKKQKADIKCCVCKEEQTDFTNAQRKLADKGLDAMCRSCWDKKHTKQKLPVIKCCVCGGTTECEFPKSKREKARRGNDAKCSSCLEKEAQQEQRRKEKEAGKAQQDAKRDALLSAPRKCCCCGQTKAKKEFSSFQWDGETLHYSWVHKDYGLVTISRDIFECIEKGEPSGKCLVCYPKETEDFDRAEKARLADEVNRRESVWQNLLDVSKDSASFFEYPGRLWHGSSEYCKTTLPDLLVGEYDVIFHHGCWDSGNGGVQRAVDARLTLSHDGEKLRGSVVFASEDDSEGDSEDDTEFIYESWDRPNFDFEEASRDDGSINFKIVKLPRDFEECANIEADENGCIRVLNKRVACRWILDEEIFDNGDGSEETPNGFIPKFSSAEEADAYLLSQSQLHKNSWMTRHLGLEPDLVSLVHEYSRPWRPSPPVLFFEEGDLLINAVWYPDCRGDHAESQFIARRR